MRPFYNQWERTQIIDQEWQVGKGKRSNRFGMATLIRVVEQSC